jgi:hypothetical protein
VFVCMCVCVCVCVCVRERGGLCFGVGACVWRVRACVGLHIRLRANARGDHLILCFEGGKLRSCSCFPQRPACPRGA